MGVLLNGEDCKWDFTKSKTPAQTFAYRLREAFSIARLHPGKFPPLDAIAEDVVVEVEGNIVYARLGKKMHAPLPDPVAQYATRGDLSILGGAANPPTPIRYSLATIQALWSKRQGDSIMLAMYVPDDTELYTLYAWGMQQTPRVMLMPADTELTLIEASDELVGMNWEPEQPESPLL
jgi:hypothetical protein